MKCKNDDNKMLAKGLCRKCYDALPSQIARRTRDMSIRSGRKLITYKDTPEFKAYIKRYKETEEYKEYIKAAHRIASNNFNRKKRGELLHDSQTKTRGNTTGNDKQISQVHTGYS